MGVALALVTGVGLAPFSSADTVGDKKKLDADLFQLRTELEDTSKDLTNAFVELRRTKALLPGARQALKAAEAAQTVADNHNDVVATALAVAEANQAKAADSLRQNARSTQRAQDQLGNMAREVYQRGGVSSLSMVLEASSPEEFTNRMVMMDTVTRIRGARLRGLDTVRADGRAVRAHLIAVRQEVAALKVQAEAALVQAQVARETAVAAKSKLDLLFVAQKRYATTVASKKATELTSINAMQAQSNALERTLAARARAARARAARSSRQPRSQGGGSQRSVSGFLGYPVSAAPSSPFGMRFHPIHHRWILHAGMDFGAGCGSPVRAAADGEIIMATPVSQSGGYGNRLVIDHGMARGFDLTTTYNHLTSFVVTGGYVRRGEVVAYSGTTGSSTGCHLHFETRQDGVPVNPKNWL
jgi:murein DD-endopeptidase MepM/ murein hydrolase activator NlpD